MYATFGRRYDLTSVVSGASRRPGKRASSSELSPASAIALLFAGVMVETLGLALIAAYGWVLAGGAIAICGLVVGVVADRRWPEQGLTSLSVLESYLSIVRRAGVGATATRRSQV
jgi:hypothetical protein